MEICFLPKYDVANCVIGFSLIQYQSLEKPWLNRRRDFFFKRFYLFIFRERGKEGEKEGEKHQYVVVSHTPPTGDLAHNPGMCSDCESNQRPFALHSGAQSTEPHQPGLSFSFFLSFCFFKEISKNLAWTGLHQILADNREGKKLMKYVTSVKNYSPGMFL